MTKKRSIIIASCYAVWCLLNWVPGLEALLLGIPVAVFAALITEDIPVGSPNYLFFHPKRYFVFIFQYLPVFWWQHLLANLDVAYRVLHPDLPICPAVVSVKTVLRSDMGLTLLANSISLVPGTTAIDVDQDKGILYVHCMAVSPDDPEAAARNLVETFEKILVEVFEP